MKEFLEEPCSIFRTLLLGLINVLRGYQFIDISDIVLRHFY